MNEHFLTQKAGKSMSLTTVPGLLSRDDYGIAVKKGNKKLKARLEKAYDAVVADGTYQKIYEKWFGKQQ